MSGNNKYRLTDDSMMYDGEVIFRIEALQDIDCVNGVVRKGELGGYVSSEDNLSFEDGDTSWVADNSIVLDDSHVGGNSVVNNESVIKDGSLISGGSQTYGNIIVVGSELSDKSTVVNNTPYNEEVSPSLVNSNVFGSEVFEMSLIDSNIDSSTLGKLNMRGDGKVITSEINDSVIGHSEISFSEIDKSTIIAGNVINGSVIDNSLIGKSNIYDSLISNGTFMGEDVYGVTNDSELTLNDDDLADLNSLDNGISI